MPGESFWDAAIRKLELKIVFNETELAKWPKTGPLVVVSNHPYGVLDGVVISHLVSKVRNDFRVLTNSVLYRAEEIREYLLPIDFAETEEALKTNLKSRAEAKAHLLKGGCLVIFPAGGVSTTPTVWHKRAIDTEWKTFTARLITQAKAPVAPVFFAGQNSRLFQVASHLSMTLRLSLIFKEVHDRIGSEVHVRVGATRAVREPAFDGRPPRLHERVARDDLCAGPRRADAAQDPHQTPAHAAQEPHELLRQSRPFMSHRVGLFVTCLVDLVRPQVGFAAVKLLEDAGCTVEVPATQTCCGQPAWNAGADAHTADIARAVIDAFEPFDYVVAPSGSCAGMIKNHYPEALANDAAYAKRARALAAKTYELTSFLVRICGVTTRDRELPGESRLSRFLLEPARDGREERAAPACCNPSKASRCRN